MVKSADSASGTVTYEASFMEEATIKGMDDQTISKEQFSNLLISGFGGNAGANRSVGWLKLGQFPAQMTIAFGDSEGETKLTGGQSDLKEIVEKKRVEMSLETAEDVGELAPAGGAAPAAGASAPESPAPAAPAAPEGSAP